MILSGELVIDVVKATVSRNGHELTPVPDKKSYLHVRLYKDRRRRSFAMHKLVWMAASISSRQ